MRTIRKYIIWLAHMGSWMLGLYLFYQGMFWPGVGAIGASCVIWTLYFLLFVSSDPEYLKLIAKGAEEGKEKARREAYEREIIRLNMEKR